MTDTIPTTLRSRQPPLSMGGNPHRHPAPPIGAVQGRLNAAAALESVPLARAVINEGHLAPGFRT